MLMLLADDLPPMMMMMMMMVDLDRLSLSMLMVMVVVVVVVDLIDIVKHVDKGLKVPDFERNSTKMNLTFRSFFLVDFVKNSPVQLNSNSEMMLQEFATRFNEIQMIRRATSI